MPYAIKIPSFELFDSLASVRFYCNRTVTPVHHYRVGGNCELRGYLLIYQRSDRYEVFSSILYSPLPKSFALVAHFRGFAAHSSRKGKKKTSGMRHRGVILFIFTVFIQTSIFTKSPLTSRDYSSSFLSRKRSKYFM